MLNKFLVVTVQYNKEKDAINLNPTKMFDTKKEAEAYFYTQIGKDESNSVLGSSVNFLLDNRGGVHDVKYWIDDMQPIPNPEIIEEEFIPTEPIIPKE